MDPLRLLCTICGKVCVLGVRLSCCLVQACEPCAKKEVTDTSTCWTCKKTVAMDHISLDEGLRARVFKWNTDLTFGLPLRCSISFCNKRTKRLVNTPCCWTPACMNCAVKQLTTSRVCWRVGCKKRLTTDQLVIDRDFRKASEYFEINGRLDECHARLILLKIWKHDPIKREMDIVCTICRDICKMGVKAPCCNAKACRVCAIHKLIENRACYGCQKTGITSLMLKNDYALREKVGRFRWNPLYQRDGSWVCAPTPPQDCRPAESQKRRKTFQEQMKSGNVDSKMDAESWQTEYEARKKIRMMAPRDLKYMRYQSAGVAYSSVYVPFVGVKPYAGCRMSSYNRIDSIKW